MTRKKDQAKYFEKLLEGNAALEALKPAKFFGSKKDPHADAKVTFVGTEIKFIGDPIADISYAQNLISEAKNVECEPNCELCKEIAKYEQPTWVPQIYSESPVEPLVDILPGLKALAKCPEPSCVKQGRKAEEINGYISPMYGMISHPICYVTDDLKVMDIVVHLNDDCDWSRDKIADWLETLDADLAFPTPDSPDAPEDTEGKHYDNRRR